MKRLRKLNFFAMAVTATAVLLSGCADTGGVNAGGASQPPTSTPRPTASASSPGATQTPGETGSGDEGLDGEDVVTGVDPHDYVHADASGYRTWMGITEDNPAPHIVGLDGDHSLLDGVDFTTPDGGIQCSLYSPYYRESEGGPLAAISCWAGNAEPPRCRNLWLGLAYDQPTPPACGATRTIDLTGIPVATLPVGSSLTWEGSICAVVRVDAVECAGNGYWFTGTSAGGFSS